MHSEYGLCRAKGEANSTDRMSQRKLARPTAPNPVLNERSPVSMQGPALITTVEEKEALKRWHESQKEQERAVSTLRKTAMLKVRLLLMVSIIPSCALLRAIQARIGRLEPSYLPPLQRGRFTDFCRAD